MINNGPFIDQNDQSIKGENNVAVNLQINQ